MTRILFALFLVLGGMAAMQWHDDYTERQIAKAYECGDIVVPAVERPVILTQRE